MVSPELSLLLCDASFAINQADVIEPVALGNMIGPQFFLNSQAPYYELGILAMLCSFCVMAVMGALYW